ncbi:uncharacterized protein EHS24_006761 [Apiotrichum porosum]|uniref:VOC domain-containing protein n=1 Tax=Apiotrichum porosum TaxID=105984 RepID=A0A427XW73_9TREE|nr:uncharacterized protein EHS24_006761 [Apiotrichum porosum]RSH83104.1 hypothetical protein EHS24_006761 [Apiotrichum porosum]
MIDHLYLRVSNYAASKAFYSSVLEAIGAKAIMEFPGLCGYGQHGSAFKQVKFFIADAAKGPEVTPIHCAFRCETSHEVDEFYNKALAAGAKDNGQPGIRAHFQPNYYAAYVLDPDGHNIEAVCHTGIDK